MRDGDIDMTNEEYMMFGISEKAIRDQYIDGPWNKLVGTEMTIMSILSDAQHVMEFGDNESARKYMNIAKYILSDIMDQKRK